MQLESKIQIQHGWMQWHNMYQNGQTCNCRCFVNVSFGDLWCTCIIWKLDPFASPEHHNRWTGRKKTSVTSLQKGDGCFLSKPDRNFQQLPQWCIILCFCSLIMVHFYHHITEVKRFPCKYDAQLPFLTLQNAEGGPPSTLIWDIALLFVNALPESKGGRAPIDLAKQLEGD